MPPSPRPQRRREHSPHQPDSPFERRKVLAHNALAFIPDHLQPEPRFWLSAAFDGTSSGRRTSGASARQTSAGGRADRAVGGARRYAWHAAKRLDVGAVSSAWPPRKPRQKPTLPRDGDHLRIAAHLCLERTPAQVDQTVIAPPLVIQRWIGSVSRLRDQPIGEHALERAIERARAISPGSGCRAGPAS